MTSPLRHGERTAAQVRRFRGFSLVELMIVLAILAILAAISIPFYNAYARRTYRAEAQADLVSCAQGLERLAAVNFRYVTDDGSLPALTPPICDPLSERQGRYRLSLAHPEGDDQRFVLRATPIEPGPMAGNGYLEYDDAGNRVWDRDDNQVIDLPFERSWQE
ncbi:MAG: type IV pilin protein [Pseudomonadales bacterium]